VSTRNRINGLPKPVKSMPSPMTKRVPISRWTIVRKQNARCREQGQAAQTNGRNTPKFEKRPIAARWPDLMHANLHCELWAEPDDNDQADTAGRRDRCNCLCELCNRNPTTPLNSTDHINGLVSYDRREENLQSSDWISVGALVGGVLGVISTSSSLGKLSALSVSSVSEITDCWQRVRAKRALELRTTLALAKDSDKSAALEHAVAADSENKKVVMTSAGAGPSKGGEIKAPAGNAAVSNTTLT
jgi:hypothetical protein